jgi:hypothetical protein
MTEAALPAYEAETNYRVELKTAARVAGIRFLPRGELTMRGDMLTRLIEENGADVVLAAQPE